MEDETWEEEDEEHEEDDGDEEDGSDEEEENTLLSASRFPPSATQRQADAKFQAWLAQANQSSME
jgi:hypothetical protein